MDIINANLILFILICFGLTNILVYSKILDFIRPKYYFFNCPMCIGFWVGSLVYLCQNSIAGNFVDGFLMSSLSSGTSYILCNLFGDEGIKIEFKKS